MITGYVGLIGQGKTMLAASDAIETAQRRGALLASNIKLSPGPGVEFVPLVISDDGLDLDQLDTLVTRCKRESRGLVLLIDEVGIIMPARFWQSFPIGLMFVLSQSRKLSLDLIWTSQDVEQVDAFLRRLTQWVYKVRAVPTPSLERREKGKRPWLMIKSKYRPAHVTAAASDKRVGRDFIRYDRARESLYDTDELVMPPLNLGRSRRQSASGLGPDGQRITPGAGSSVTAAAAQARVRSDRASGPVDRESGDGGAPAAKSSPTLRLVAGGPASAGWPPSGDGPPEA